jgi:hypothetical protein
LHLASLSVQSGLGSSGSSSGGSNGAHQLQIWDDDSDSGSEDEFDAGGQQQQQQQQQFGWEQDPLVLQLLSGGSTPAAAAATAITVEAAPVEERNLSRALANLTNLSVLTVNRVPTLIARRSSSSSGSNGGGSGSSVGSSNSEMLPDVLASLGKLRELSVPLLLRDTQLSGAWGCWSTSLVTMQVCFMWGRDLFCYFFVTG